MLTAERWTRRVLTSCSCRPVGRSPGRSLRHPVGQPAETQVFSRNLVFEGVTLKYKNSFKHSFYACMVLEIETYDKMFGVMIFFIKINFILH